MGIKRYLANQDTTVTNAFESSLTTRGTGSNMGESDITEVFEIYGQASTSSLEKSRALYKFPLSDVASDRTAGTIEASGSVKFNLRLYNAKHASTTPKNAVFYVAALTRSWDEGSGLDMDNYKDKGYANWEKALSGSDSGVEAWGTEGGDYYEDPSSSFSVTMINGSEDINIDVTTLVEQWLTSSNLGSKDNHGVIVKLSGAYEDGEKKRSYYTKKFFARGTEFFYKRPMLEARWDSSRQDDRGNLYYSSSLAPAANNLNTLYFYNYINGQLTNIPDLGTDNRVYVSVFSGTADNSAPTASALTLVADNNGHVRAALPTVVTGGLVTTGIYSASFALTGATTPLTTLFDVWFTGSDATAAATAAATQYFTGTISPNIRRSSQRNSLPQHVAKITNLKPVYTTLEEPRIRLFTREKNQNVNVYTVATSEVQNDIVDNVYYKVQRVYDGFDAVSYGTGSAMSYYSRLSFDVSGSYFDFDMSLLEAGYMYAFKFALYLAGDYQELDETFKFRVE